MKFTIVEHLNGLPLMDGAGGEVVSVLAFNSDVSISNPVDVYIFYFTKLHEKKPEFTLKFASGQVNRHT